MAVAQEEADQDSEAQPHEQAEDSFVEVTLLRHNGADTPLHFSQNEATNYRIAVARVTLRRGKSSGAEPHTKGVGRI